MAYLYRGAQSPREEGAFSNFSANPLSPPRNPNRLSAGMMPTSDARGPLTRRFTTNALPTLSPIGQQRRQAAGDTQMCAAAYNRVPPSERRIRHIESLLEQQRRIEAELEQVDNETKREIEQGLRHERGVTQIFAQSEPTTPPDYQDTFPASVSRPNRYSTNSLSSVPGVTTRSNRSSTQLTSPSAGVIRSYTATTASNLPSQSVPASRRQSDDEEDEQDFLFGGYDSAYHRAAKNPNRNSLPVTSYDRQRNAAGLSSNLGPLNTTSFLFDDEEKPSSRQNQSSNQTSPPDTKTYLQMQHTADGFPKLIRREENGEPVTVQSAALDLALAQAPSSEQQVPERTTGSRHRISLPPSALSSGGAIAPLNSILANASDAKAAANNRRSMEVKFTAETKRPSLMASPPRSMPNGNSSKSQSSYSTNDLPTLKTINGDNSGGVPLNSPPSQSAQLSETSSTEQNASTLNALSSANTSNRQSQDFSHTTRSQESNNDNISSPTSFLGPTNFNSMYSQDAHQAPNFGPNMSPYSQPAYFGGFGMNGANGVNGMNGMNGMHGINSMHALNNNFGGMNLNGAYGAQGQWQNSISQYQQGFNNFQQFPQNGQVVAGAGRLDNNNNSRSLQQRKPHHDDMFQSVAIPDLRGQIYSLCKDQHGCRFLQKKLEDRNEQEVQIIFEEVKDHFTELMVDPFGNYLCQRLLEYTNDAQRTILVEKAVPSMTHIALNQHGTRALQRMIEAISTEEQTNLIIEALRFDVVQLIQDLNGNHVIQKCLNHLSSRDAQFIFDAVGNNCVVVGTHRHGCCVLQRCVDHASGLQKGALVKQIIENSFSLVQDPFGNYVVQYIIDLGEESFTEPLCHKFANNVAYLSKQKFSSNVMEKAIRSSSVGARRALIEEINNPGKLEELLRDSFANYVVQTAMDFADDDTKARMFDNVRPILPGIRHTPYGRRIQSKIQEYDGANGTSAASADMNAQGPFSVPQGRTNRMGMVGPPAQWPSNTFGAPSAPAPFLNNNGDMNAPAPQRNQAYTFLSGTQNHQNYGYNGSNFRNGPTYNHF